MAANKRRSSKYGGPKLTGDFQIGPLSLSLTEKGLHVSNIPSAGSEVDENAEVDEEYLKKADEAELTSLENEALEFLSRIKNERKRRID